MLYYILDFLKDNDTGVTYKDTFYQKTKIHFNGPFCGKNQECGIFDILGYFSCKFKDTIFICHDILKKHCVKEKLSYAIVFDIICIHEYAHLIHFHHNPKKFRTFDLGFACDKHSEDSTVPCYDSKCDNCHKYYVETWAQWLTYKICEKLDNEHESNQLSPYIKTFNLLSKNISREYLEYKRLLDLFILNDSDIIKLFLSPDGWLTDNELLKKLHYEDLISLIKPKNQQNSYIHNWPYKENLVKQIKVILSNGGTESESIERLINNRRYKVESEVIKYFKSRYDLTINESVIYEITGKQQKCHFLDDIYIGVEAGAFNPNELDKLILSIIP